MLEKEKLWLISREYDCPKKTVLREVVSHIPSTFRVAEKILHDEETRKDYKPVRTEVHELNFVKHTIIIRMIKKE